MALSAHDAIEIDSRKAEHYVNDYLAAVNAELYARGLILTGAMQKFGKFLDLPESSSRLKAIFETALTVLCFVQPELFLAKLLAEEEKSVTLALTIAEATGSKAAKAVKVAGKIGEGAEKVKGVMEKIDARQEKKEKERQAPEALLKLNQLSAKTPIRQLIATGQKALKVWRDALATLDSELAKRLDSNAKPSKETMLAMMQKMLQIPDPFSEAELDQLENLYLWQMVKTWCSMPESVTVVMTKKDMGRGPFEDQYHARGVNDTQEAALQDWFGLRAARGKIFNAPVMHEVPIYLVSLGAKMIVHRRGEPYYKALTKAD